MLVPYEFQSNSLSEYVRENGVGINAVKDHLNRSNLPEDIKNILLHYSGLSGVNEVMPPNRKWYKSLNANKYLWKSIWKELNLTSLVEQANHTPHLQRISRSRDTLVIWEHLQGIFKEKGLELDLPQFNSLEEYMNIHSEFQNWCKTHQQALAELTELDLSGKQLRFITEVIFWKLKNLRNFDLSHNQLTSVPIQLGLLKTLKQLNLSNNQLASVPEQLGLMKELSKLDLSNNQLTMLPTAIGNLINLWFLDLSHNKLISLPKAFRLLRNLQILNLSNNQLTSLPDKVWELINQMPLTDQPASLSNAFKEELLNDFPEDIIKIILDGKVLSEINQLMLINKRWHKIISNNKGFLCDKIFNKFLMNDKKLISWNKVTYKSNEKKKMVESTVRKTEEQIIIFFTEVFKEIFPAFTLISYPDPTKELKDLIAMTVDRSMKKELDDLIANIQIEKIHEILEIAKARDTLIFWITLERILNFKIQTGKLNVTYESIESGVDGRHFRSVKKLLETAKGFPNWCYKNQDNLLTILELCIDNLCLTSIPAEIGLLKNLQNLKLGNNKLTYLPAEIGQLTQLTYLELMHNRLKSLPAEIGELTLLWGLKLQGNFLTRLPDEIWNLTNLWSLCLSDNLLTTVSFKIGRLKELSILTLTGNPLIALPKILKSSLKSIKGSVKSEVKLLELEDDKKADPNLWFDENDDNPWACPSCVIV